MPLARMQCATGTVLVKVRAAFGPLATTPLFLDNWSQYPEHEGDQLSFSFDANDI